MAWMLRLRGPTIVLAAVALLVGSCSFSPAAGEPRTRIEFWTLALSPRFDDFILGLVEKFEQQNPDIDVVWVDVPYDQMQRKFTAACAAKRAPDLVNLSDGNYARFVAMGGLADISGYLPGDANAVYLPGSLVLCRMKGGLYALPWYLSTPVAYLNRRLLAEAGWEPSRVGQTWDRVLAQASEFRPGPGKFLFTPLLGQESELPLRMIEAGLRPLRAKADGTGIEANLTDPAVVGFVSGWVQAYRSGALPRVSATHGHASAIELYQNGRTALLVTSPNMLERVRDASPEVFEATHVVPAIHTRDQPFTIATMLLAVTSQSRHPREAARLAWFVTSPENQLAFCRLVSILPSTAATLDDPLFAAPDPESRQTAAGKVAYARHLSAQSLRNARTFVPPLPAWPELTAAFSEGIKAALLDGRDVAQTLAKMEREWNQILATHPPVDPAVLQ